MNNLMPFSLNKPKLDNLAGDIWKSAERLRGKVKAYEYQNVILPIIVIRRLECVLIDWREKKTAEVRSKRSRLTGKELSRLVKGMELGTAPFSNKNNQQAKVRYGNSLIHECVTGQRRTTESDLKRAQAFSPERTSV